jgi:hypothetical protein
VRPAPTQHSLITSTVTQVPSVLVRLLVVFLLAGIAHPLRGQVIRGAVHEAGSGRAVGRASVMLISEAGDRVGIPFITRDDGAFTLTLPTAGRFAVRAARIGYAPVESRLFHVQDGEEVFANVVMEPNAAAMSAVEVEVERAPVGAGLLADYEYRRRRGLGGTFVTKEQIEMHGHVRVQEVLSSVVGVQVIGAMRGQTYIEMSRAAALGRRCPATVYLDGTRQATAATIFELDVSAIEGVEIYKGPSNVPLEFGGTAARCGVVAVWTKRG